MEVCVVPDVYVAVDAGETVLKVEKVREWCVFNMRSLTQARLGPVRTYLYHGVPTIPIDPLEIGCWWDAADVSADL